MSHRQGEKTYCHNPGKLGKSFNLHRINTV